MENRCRRQCVLFPSACRLGWSTARSSARRACGSVYMQRRRRSVSKACGCMQVTALQASQPQSTAAPSRRGINLKRTWILLFGLPTLNVWPCDLSGWSMIRQTASTASSTKQKVRYTSPPLTKTRGSPFMRAVMKEARTRGWPSSLPSTPGM